MDMELFCPDFQPRPYWWDDAPPLEGEAALPAQCDALVIGGGYTGLSAALELARRGVEVVVAEKEAVGWGCSSRNGGQVSDGVKPDFAALARAHGAERAGAIIAEAEQALFWLGELIEAEGIDCDFRRCGRFHGVHKPSAYDRLAHEVAERNRHAGRANGAFMVPRSEQGGEVQTEGYYGGAVFPEHFSVHPGKLLRGLAQLAGKAGAKILSRCGALEIKQTSTGFRVATQRGAVDCRRLILATNGYTNAVAALAPWQRRRIIPIGSYIIATEPLEDGLMQRLLPTDRVISDTRKVVYYYRSSPDRRRMIFGGRVSCGETDPRISAPLLHREMRRLFPQLAGARISHSWCGFVGFTFDKLMHIGCQDGIYYAMGYCGSGVALSTWLGRCIARKCLGDTHGSAFDGLRFASAPFYSGTPWFLSALLAYYQWRDRATA